MRWFTGLLVLTLAIGAGVYHGKPNLWRQWTAFTRPAVKPKPATSAAARRIFAGGTVEGAHRDIALHFEIAGRISGIAVKEGDRVEKGDLLAELDGEVWELRLAEAQARLKLARAERTRLVNGASQEARQVLRNEVATAEVHVREGESQLARGKQLAQRNAISTQQLDDFRYQYEKAAALLHTVHARLEEMEAPVRSDDLSVAEAKVSLAEAVVKQEQNMLEKSRLRAPSSGIILQILAELGELVSPIQERDLLTIVNRDSTRVRAYVEELDALSVHVGQAAIVKADGKPDRPYAGIVASCSPSVRPKSHKHHKPGELVDQRVREVVIELANGIDLVVGLPVDVFIARETPAANRSAAPDENAARRSTLQEARNPAQPPDRAEDEASNSQRIVKPQVEPIISAVDNRTELSP